MVQPFADFDAYKEQEQAERAVGYAKKMLTLIIRELMPEAAAEMRRDAGDDFGFRWFNDSCTSRLNLSLDAMEQPVPAVDLLKAGGVTKTTLWQRYFDLVGEYGSPFGLIFLMPGLGQWIMHDCAQLPLAPGYAHIMRISAKEDKKLVIQPLAAFIAAMKQA